MFEDTFFDGTILTPCNIPLPGLKKKKFLILWSSKCGLEATNMGIPQELMGNAGSQASLQTLLNQNLHLNKTLQVRGQYFP